MRLRPTVTTILWATIAAAGLLACSGPLADQLYPGSSGGAPGEGPGGGLGGSTNPPGDVGSVTIHRLNAAEYDNTVRDLLGDTSRPSAAFPPDDGANSFTNNADALSISPLLLEQYEAAAERLATNALTNPKIVTCDGSTGADACGKQILTPFVKRAWRRPATADEITGLLGLLQVAAQEGQPFNQGIQLAIKATLLSPNFQFRVELDPAPSDVTPHPLNDYELASRLSYFLWSSMPDDALFASADTGKLAGDPYELDAQAKRMLEDPKAQALLDNFASQWLNHTLGGAMPDTNTFPSFDEGLREAMAGETKAFVGSFLFGEQSLPDILDANFTYLNGRMATAYGISGITGSDFVRVPIDPSSHRGGILTHASVLTMTSIATRTSPVRRGAWVLSDLLCAPPPPPPADVPALPTTGSSGTIRQQMEQHQKQPGCSGCHTQMDPIGFAMEHYDAIGRWRDDDQNQPIDATGKLPTGQTVDGAAQLAQVIKQDPRFLKCATQKVFSYALGREPQSFDAERIDALKNGLTTTEYRAKELIMNIIRNDAFRMRRGGN